MERRPHVLITNDDGINAPGIFHLWKALKDMAKITIIAPETEQSGVALSITCRVPLHVQKVLTFEGTNAYSVSGTPSDCVKLAVSLLLQDDPPDFVFSGINRGCNAGRNLLHSGTVGGVVTGVLNHIPGAAFSCQNYQEPGYDVAQKYIPSVVRYIINHPLPRGTFLNVNFPASIHENDVKGFKLARQGLAYWKENPSARTHPTEGHDYYWLGMQTANFDEHDESDITLLKKGFVTAVPIFINDLTHEDHLESEKEKFESFFNK